MSYSVFVHNPASNRTWLVATVDYPWFGDLFSVPSAYCGGSLFFQDDRHIYTFIVNIASGSVSHVKGDNAVLVDTLHCDAATTPHRLVGLATLTANTATAVIAADLADFTITQPCNSTRHAARGALSAGVRHQHLGSIDALDLVAQLGRSVPLASCDQRVAHGHGVGWHYAEQVQGSTLHRQDPFFVSDGSGLLRTNRACQPHGNVSRARGGIRLKKKGKCALVVLLSCV
jgi:hypothetical protein